MSLQQELLGLANSVGELFRRRVAETPDRVAFMDPDRTPEGDGKWTDITWGQTRDIVDPLAAGLIARGLQPEQRVGIMCSTRVEWVFADLAINCAAGATTTVYPNTAAGEVDYILGDSECVMVFAENKEQAAKIDADGSVKERVHTIILIDADGAELSDRVLSFDQLRELGSKLLAEQPDVVDKAIAGTNLDTLCTLIYTSGTSGPPKGVKLHHAAVVYEASAIGYWKFLGIDDVHYLWLPLSHVFGKILLAVGLNLGFKTAVDGRIDKIVPGLGQVGPTVMCGVPRIFEKVRIAVMTGNEGLKGRISHWAFSVGAKSRKWRMEGKQMPLWLDAQYRVADRLVFSKLKKTLGGNLKFMISGAAKLNPQVQEWFYSAGILIIEGYGSTETSAIAFLNLPSVSKFGSVGQPLPGTDAKIAEDGEILVRGPHVTTGYHNLPEQTAEVIDEDGWFHTGDIGFFDSDGDLHITERKKDLFKTSGGKYVAPQKVENAITTNIPYVSQAVAVGDGHKYVSALVVMDPDLLQKWAAKRGLENLSYADLSQRPEIHESIERQMVRANEKLEHWETVKRFAILDHQLTAEANELTPNQKIRRSVINEKYGDLIESLYDKEP